MWSPFFTKWPLPAILIIWFFIKINRVITMDHQLLSNINLQFVHWWLKLQVAQIWYVMVVKGPHTFFCTCICITNLVHIFFVCSEITPQVCKYNKFALLICVLEVELFVKVRKQYPKIKKAKRSWVCPRDYFTLKWPYFAKITLT